MIIKDIPEIIKVDSRPYLVLPVNQKNLKHPEELKEIKNTAVSGIVIKGSLFRGNGNVLVYDPRGFYCDVTNFDELIEHIDISRGVIEQDLWYGISNTTYGSWILLTAEMKNQSKKAFKSIKELKPGFVYKNYGDPLVYLGRCMWKDEYGTPRPHQTFVNPEKREIICRFGARGSDFEPLGYDLPDVYEEAKNLLLNSYQGSRDVMVSKIFLPDGMKYTAFENSLLIPERFRHVEMYNGVRASVMFVKQKDEENINIVSFHSGARRYKKHLNPWCKEEEAIDVTSLHIGVTETTISIQSGIVKLSYSNFNLPETYIDTFDLSSWSYLERIIHDPGYKCLDFGDKKTWDKFRNADVSLRYCQDLLTCVLTNGEKKDYRDIIVSYIDF